MPADIPSESVPCLLPGERLDAVNENVRLIQKVSGLTFGTDAYLLAAFVRPQPRAVAVDLGSGTGILPLLLAARGKVARITAVEIQPAFAELIARNIRLNAFEDRITSLCADVRELTAAKIGGEVDLVISNPPYMRCGAGERNRQEEKYIARHEVCGTVSDFCAAAGRLLRYGGKFVCVWRPDRLTELLAAMRQASLEPKRMTFVHADADTPPSAVLTEAIKGAAPALRVTAPLLLYQKPAGVQSRRNLTDAAQKIYDTCLFPD